MPECRGASDWPTLILDLGGYLSSATPFLSSFDTGGVWEDAALKCWVTVNASTTSKLECTDLLEPYIALLEL